MPKEEIKYLERRLELQEFLENLRFLLEAITPNENLYLEYADDDQRPFDQQESIVLQVLYAKRLHKVVGEFEIRRQRHYCHYGQPEGCQAG